MSTSVVDVLESQHRRIGELFEQVSSPDADRPIVLRELLKELAAHVAAERSAVAPVVKERDLGDGLAGQLHDDYDRIDKLMVLIERRKFHSPDVPELVSDLKEATEQHVSRSERELFPELGRALSADEQREVGERVRDGDELVISHPHPHLLSLGPIADKITALTSRWDRLRDKTVTNTPPPKNDEAG